MEGFENEDDDVSYLVPPKRKEKMWCQINEKNEMNFVDWDTVKKVAYEFDLIPQEQRKEHHLICKLMWESRNQSMQEERNKIIAMAGEDGKVDVSLIKSRGYGR
ncbi:MAG: hypothetical protein ACO3I1_04060 [Burkholderiales bacterium]